MWSTKAMVQKLNKSEFIYFPVLGLVFNLCVGVEKKIIELNWKIELYGIMAKYDFVTFYFKNVKMHMSLVQT